MSTNHEKEFNLPNLYIWYIKHSLKITILCILILEFYFLIAYREFPPVITGFLFIWLIIMIIINHINKNTIYSLKLNDQLEIVEFSIIGSKKKLIYNFADIESIILKWAYIFKIRGIQFKYPDYKNKELLKILNQIKKVDNKRSSLGI